MTAEGELIVAPSSAQLGTSARALGRARGPREAQRRAGGAVGGAHRRPPAEGRREAPPLDAAETGTALATRGGDGPPVGGGLRAALRGGGGRVSVAEAAKARLHGRRTMAQTLADARAVFERRSKQTAALQARRRRRRQEQQAAEEVAATPEAAAATDSSPISVAVGDLFGRPPTTTALASAAASHGPLVDRGGVGPAPRFQEPLRQSELRIINGRRHARSALAARAEFESALLRRRRREQQPQHGDPVAAAPCMMLAPSSSASPSSSWRSWAIGPAASAVLGGSAHHRTATATRAR